MTGRHRTYPGVDVVGGRVVRHYYYGRGLRFAAYATTPHGPRFAGLHESADRAAIACLAWPCPAGLVSRAAAVRDLRARLIYRLAHRARDGLNDLIAHMRATLPAK